jgi:type II secretory pathway component PulC
VRCLLLSVMATVFGVAIAVADEMPVGRSPATFQLPPLETYAEVTARPLFAPDRRPRESVPVDAGAAAPVALKGIVINGTSRYAVVEEGTPPTPKRVSEGQSVDAGTIKRINRDHIILTIRGGTDTIVRLFEPAKQRDARAAQNTSDGAAQARSPNVPAEFAKIPTSHAPLTAGPNAR